MLTLPENVTRAAQAYAYVNFTFRWMKCKRPPEHGGFCFLCRVCPCLAEQKHSNRSLRLRSTNYRRIVV